MKRIAIQPLSGLAFREDRYHRFHLWLFTFKPYGLGQTKRERRRHNPIGEVNQLPLELLTAVRRANDYQFRLLTVDRKANHYQFKVLSPDRKANCPRLEVLSPDRKSNHHRLEVLSPDRKANGYRLGIPAGDGKYFAQACIFFFCKTLDLNCSISYLSHANNQSDSP